MKKTGLILFALMVFATVFTGCQKDDKNTPGGSVNGGSGRFSAHSSCSIIAPPAGVNLNSHYQKYLNCTGVPVIGGSNIPDAALHTAEDIIAFMLKDKQEIKNTLISEGVYYALALKGEKGLLEIPEVAAENPATLAGGIAMGGYPMGVSNVDNLMCTADNINVGENVLVHEMAHLIHLSALNVLYPGFNAEVEAAYKSAMQAGLWKNTYSASKSTEYFAVGVAIWYNVQTEGPEGGNGTHGSIHTRAQLKDYDPGLYNLIAKHFNHETDVPGCLKPVYPNNKPCVATVEDIDGNVYDVVSIGAQCWMKQNLKTTRFNDGTPIKLMTEVQNWHEIWFKQEVPSYIYYGHNAADNNTHGKLYNWFAAKDSRICPKGWHIPTREEFVQLVKQTGGMNSDGKSLKATTTWDNNGANTNTSGFTALATGGMLGYDFGERGKTSFFWTTTPVTQYPEIANALRINADKLIEYNGEIKQNGLSCRCVMD